MTNKLTDFEFTTETPPEEEARSKKFTWWSVFELAESKPDTWLRKTSISFPNYLNVKNIGKKYSKQRKVQVETKLTNMTISVNGSMSGPEVGTIWIKVKLSPVDRMDSDFLK